MIRKTLTKLAAAVFLASPAKAADLSLGDAAPTFEAKDQDGNAITSAELYKAGTTLFFFYPKAGTGG